MTLVTAMSMCCVCHFKRDAVHRRLAAYTHYIHKHQLETVAATFALLQPLVNLQFHLNKQYSSLNDVCISVCMQNFQWILNIKLLHVYLHTYWQQDFNNTKYAINFGTSTEHLIVLSVQKTHKLQAQLTQAT